VVASPACELENSTGAIRLEESAHPLGQVDVGNPRVRLAVSSECRGYGIECRSGRVRTRVTVSRQRTLALPHHVYHSRHVPLDPELLRQARHERDRAVDLQYEADQAQVGSQHAIRRLHGAGASLREIADALGLSYQRVHQIVDPGSGKGAVRECQTDRACSFCGAAQRQVSKLIAGPGVFICERCFALANEVLAEGEERSNRWTTLAPEQDAEARCNFCGKRRRHVAWMIVAPGMPPVGKFGRKRYARRFPGVRECSDCLALCGEIMAEQFA
jgi:hypothetical protein